MLKIAVVTSDPRFSHAIGESLQRYQQLSCSFLPDGTQALDACDRDTPDIMLLDMELTPFSGLELVRQIRLRQNSSYPIFILFSTRQDFKTLQTALNLHVFAYLLKPLHDAQFYEAFDGALKHLKESRSSSFFLPAHRSRKDCEMPFYTLLHSHEAGQRKKAENILRASGYFFDTPYYQCVIIPVSDAKLSTGQNYTLADQRYQQILDRLTEALELPHIASFDSISDDEFIILLGGPSIERLEQEVQSLFRALAGLLRENPGLKLFLGAGRVVNSNEILYVSYRTAKYASCRKIAGLSKPFYVWSKSSDSNNNLILNTHLEMNLYIRLMMNDNRGANQMVAAEIEKAKHSFPKLYQLCDSIRFIVDWVCTNTQKGSCGQAIPTIDLFWNTDEMLALMQARIDKLCLECRKCIQKSPQQSIVLQMLQYLSENYARNINLNVVALTLKKNPSYLSTLFKQEMNESVTQYLAKLRISKAQELLSDTTKSIREICDAVGIASTKNFAQLFKSFTQFTPTEYRKFMLQNSYTR